MLFNSYLFVAFLAAVLVIHYSPLSWRTRKLNLLLASYLFYAAWNPPFVLLIWISTLLDWHAARRMRVATRASTRKRWLVASLAGNLGLLGFFKYGGFLLDNFVAVVQAVGFDFQPAAPSIVLPVGISFYTFQTLSYSIDVYRGRLQPSRSFLDFALFVTFFPQLVAGPIVRAADFLPQCAQPRRATERTFGWGVSLIILGLFQKTVLADGLLAPVAEAVYDATTRPDPLSAWIGTLAFAGQIFLDFAAYSTIAIGVALTLGFWLPDNFRFPYAAVGFSDFWRRWHMSLSGWLRDYLYIPLGGGQAGRWLVYRNLMFTMLLGGLWHGASWTFVAWGCLHGGLLVAERSARSRFGHLAVWRYGSVRFGLGILTFVLVSFTWVFFRAHSFDQAFAIAGAMLGLGSALSGVQVRASDVAVVTTLMSALLAAHWLLRDRSLEEVVGRTPWWTRSLALSLMIIAITLAPGNERAFLYFQF